MNTFFERHKKKGLLALLLLFLKRGKGVGPLLLLVLLMSFLFVAPSGMGFHSPFVKEVARKLGINRFFGGDDSLQFAGISEALKAARANRGLTLAGVGSGWFGRGLAASYGGPGGKGANSLEMVRGGRSLRDGDMGGAGRGATGDRLPQGGRSVGGILTPEDAGQKGGGVALSENELIGGLLKNARGGRGDGLDGRGGGVDGSGGNGAFGGEGVGYSGPGAPSTQALQRGAAIDPHQAMVHGSFNGTGVPPVGGGRGVAGGRPPGSAGAMAKLAWKFKNWRYRIADSMGSPNITSRGDSAIYQVTEARAYSVVAAPPLCPDNASCPREFASTVGGAPFVGARPNIPQSLYVPDIGEAVPIPPSVGTMQTEVDRANQLEEDARKCEEAERTFGPQERTQMANLQAKANELNAAGCNSGGCSRAKATQCRGIGDQMRVICGNLNNIVQQKMAACPLMTGTSPGLQDCNQ